MTNEAATRTGCHSWPIWLVGAGLALASIVYVFFIPISSGLTWLYGDSTDGLIEVAILEHWRNVLTGASTWNVTSYFYPYPDTLGYNDTYFLPGIEYALARQVLDPLAATMLTHATLRLIGFMGMAVLLRRALGTSLGYAFVGATLFTCANAAVMQMWHGQLNHLGLAPWLLTFLLLAYRALQSQDRIGALRWGGAAALTYGLWALSAFYFVWFTTLFAICTAVILLAIGRGEAVSATLSILRGNAVTLTLIVVMFVIALVPFLLVYIPQLMRGEQHDWGMIAAFLPDPVTFLNVGGGNLIWGKAFIAFNNRFFPGNQIGGEDIVGFPLITMLITIVAAIWMWRNRRDPTSRLMLAALLATALIMGLMLRVPGLGSAWKLVFHVVPGGGSIRAISRFLIFATLVQFAVLMVWLSRSAVQPVAKLAIVAVLVVEQIQLAPPVSLNRPQTAAMLADVATIPAQCDSIFVMSGRTRSQLRADAATLPSTPGQTAAEHAKALADVDSVYRRNVDSMLIAAVRQRPAINGYSSFLPPDWDFLTRPAPAMINRARAYSRRHHISGICALDRTTSERWFRI